MPFSFSLSLPSILILGIVGASVLFLMVAMSQGLRNMSRERKEAQERRERLLAMQEETREAKTHDPHDDSDPEENPVRENLGDEIPTKGGREWALFVLGIPEDDFKNPDFSPGQVHRFFRLRSRLYQQERFRDAAQERKHWAQRKMNELKEARNFLLDTFERNEEQD